MHHALKPPARTVCGHQVWGYTAEGGHKAVLRRGSFGLYSYFRFGGIRPGSLLSSCFTPAFGLAALHQTVRHATPSTPALRATPSTPAPRPLPPLHPSITSPTIPAHRAEGGRRGSGPYLLPERVLKVTESQVLSSLQDIALTAVAGAVKLAGRASESQMLLSLQMLL